VEEHHVNCAQTLTEKDAADAVSASTVNPDTPNVLHTMMKLEQAKARTKNANRVKPWFRTKSFGLDSKEQTMQHISSRKRISSSGLRDLAITND
jgi:hypothetical protein